MRVSHSVWTISILVAECQLFVIASTLVWDTSHLPCASIYAVPGSLRYKPYQIVGLSSFIGPLAQPGRWVLTLLLDLHLRLRWYVLVFHWSRPRTLVSWYTA